MLLLNETSLYIGLNLEMLLKIEIEHVTVMFECNLKLFFECVFLANANKIFLRETRIHGVANYPSSATILGICGLE